MTHPLTDELIDSIAQFNSDLCAEGIRNRDHDMRAAADWQLEQVIEWLDFKLHRYTDASFDGVTEIDYDNLFKDLKKAMRPQEDNND